MKKTKRHYASLDHELSKRDTTVEIPDISATDLSNCGKWTTPACLKALYQIPDATINQKENTLGVFANKQIWDQKDLDLFFSNLAPWVPNGTHPNLVSINDAKAPVPAKDAGVESLIDFDLAHSLVYPQEVINYQTVATKAQESIWIQQYGPSANLSTAASFLPFIDALDGKLCTEQEKKSGADCGTVELTQVLSVSYGSSELQSKIPLHLYSICGHR